MWQLQKGNTFLPDTNLKNLQNLYAAERNAKAKLRLLAAIRRKKGGSLDNIAYSLEKPRRTIHGWLSRFQHRGVTAKDAIKQPGRRPMLTVKQRKKLVVDLERGPTHNPSGLWTTKEAKDLLKRRYGISFVNQHVWRLLKSLGFSLQRPRKRHHLRASDEEIERFKKKRGGRLATTATKGLLWARKMKQPSVSSLS